VRANRAALVIVGNGVKHLALGGPAPVPAARGFPGIDMLDTGGRRVDE